MILSQTRRGRDRAADPGRAPGRARLPAQGPRDRHRRLRRARCAASPPAAARSTRRSSRSCWRARPTAGALATLTPREREVLALVAEGRSNKGAGERLGVTERAVQKHVTSIFDKLGLTAGEDDNRRILAVLHLPAPGYALAASRFRHPATPADSLAAHRPGWDLQTVTRTRRDTDAVTALEPAGRPAHRRRHRARSRPPLRQRRHRRRRPARRVGRHRRGPPDRGHGPVGLRQVDADAHPRRARHADVGRGDGRRRGDRRPRRHGADASCAATTSASSSSSSTCCRC